MLLNVGFQGGISVSRSQNFPVQCSKFWYIYLLLTEFEILYTIVQLKHDEYFNWLHLNVIAVRCVKTLNIMRI